MHEALEAPTGLWTEHCNHNLDKNVMAFTEALGYSMEHVYKDSDQVVPHDFQLPLPRPNHATFDIWMDHVRHGHVPKRPDCPICQSAAPVVVMSSCQGRLEFCIVLLMFVDLLKRQEARSLSTLCAAEATPAIVDFINRVPHLRQLRGFE
eukprot:1360754-Amphidinium_carterae.1